MYETAVCVVPMSIPMTSFSSPDQRSSANGGIVQSVLRRRMMPIDGEWAVCALPRFPAHQLGQGRLNWHKLPSVPNSVFGAQSSARPRVSVTGAGGMLRSRLYKSMPRACMLDHGFPCVGRKRFPRTHWRININKIKAIQMQRYKTRNVSSTGALTTSA